MQLRNDEGTLWSDEFTATRFACGDCTLDDRGDLWVLRNSGALLECCRRRDGGSFAAQGKSIVLSDVLPFGLCSTSSLGRANSQLLFADGNRLGSIPFELLRELPTATTATKLEAESARVAGVVASSPPSVTSSASSYLVQ